MALMPVKKQVVELSSPQNRPNGQADKMGFVSEEASKEKTSSGGIPGEHPREFTIPLHRQQMIGVTYAKAERRPLTTTVRVFGTVATQKPRHWNYVSRVRGHVQDLYVASRGEIVHKGQPLLKLYSFDFLPPQRDYLEAVRVHNDVKNKVLAENTNSGERALEASRQRLASWNLSDTQIDELARKGELTEALVFSAPFDGLVFELPTSQGARVAPGDSLIDIVDLTAVWVWADIHQSDLALFRTGEKAEITLDAFSGEKWDGRIALIDSSFDATNRTGRVRIDVENRAIRLRPGMYVTVEVLIQNGSGITVPQEAVLPTGEHMLAFVSRSGGRIEPRFIMLGGKFGDRYEVRSGLAEGENVVSSANFLIDAEAKMQGALKGW